MRVKLRHVVLLATSMSLVLGYFSALPSANAATPKCFGKTATKVSSKAVISGTKGADVIVATGKGKHQINGLAGNDRICGGSGIDGANGGAGNDLINGGGGPDGTLLCQGTVELLGGAGSDTILGGAGD